MRSLPLLLAVGLAACNAVDPGMVAQLARVSPLEADPAGFRVAAHLPPGLELPEGGAVLTLGAVRGEESVEGRFVLDRDAAADATRLRVSPGDLARFRALQDRIRGWEESDPDGTSGSMAVSVTACTRAGGPDPDATISVDLATEPGGPERPLLRPVPVRRFATIVEGELGHGLLPCSNDG